MDEDSLDPENQGSISIYLGFKAKKPKKS